MMSSYKQPPSHNPDLRLNRIKSSVKSNPDLPRFTVFLCSSLRTFLSAKSNSNPFCRFFLVLEVADSLGGFPRCNLHLTLCSYPYGKAFYWGAEKFCPENKNLRQFAYNVTFCSFPMATFICISIRFKNK